MVTVKIKRKKHLNEELKSLPIGTWCEIKERDYRATSVRNAISQLRAQGFRFNVTQIGAIDCIKVQRLS